MNRGIGFKGFMEPFYLGSIYVQHAVRLLTNLKNLEHAYPFKTTHRNLRTLQNLLTVKTQPRGSV